MCVCVYVSGERRGGVEVGGEAKKVTLYDEHFSDNGSINNHRHICTLILCYDYLFNDVYLQK